MEEPSVLDYLKSRLFFWQKNDIEIPESHVETVGDSGEIRLEAGISPGSEQIAENRGIAGVFSGVLSLLPLAIILVGITAQLSLESENRDPILALVLYAAAAGLLIWLIRSRRWFLIKARDEVRDRSTAMHYRRTPAIAVLILIPISFFLFTGNLFTEINLLIWLLLILLFLAAFWEKPTGGWPNPWAALQRFFLKPEIQIRITPWTLLLLFCSGLVLFFRFYALNEVPGEMFSDHAEKLLDVSGVLNGGHLIFFPRNTGREAIQMYLTAAVGTVLSTGLSFMSLKIGTVLAGLLALPFIYLIGKRVGGKWVGLFAFLLCGVAYWPNVISRIGLRFPLYPLFAAPAIFFLIKAFQDRSRNDLLLAGLMVGLGMHGYSPFRIVPLLVLFAFILYYIFCRSDKERSKLGLNLLILALAALIVFLPLMKYMTEDPANFGSRAFSRLGSIERPLPGPLLEIFFNNFWKALVMFFWDNGNIWVHSVVGRPALDVISAVFFFAGCITITARFFRTRNWLDLFLLCSIPVLLLPSILSLAFPEENPSLNRTSGAIIPVFVLTGYGLASFLKSLCVGIGGKRGVLAAVATAILLVGLSINQNFDLVFHKFERQFMAAALNTSEIGAVVKSFTEMGGSPDTAYVVPFPYWVDTRLVGINAGFPDRDFALTPENFGATLDDYRMKLFILRPDDQANLEIIREMYPDGVLSTYSARERGKDFLTFLVPPNQ